MGQQGSCCTRADPHNCCAEGHALEKSHIFPDEVGDAEIAENNVEIISAKSSASFQSAARRRAPSVAAPEDADIVYYKQCRKDEADLVVDPTLLRSNGDASMSIPGLRFLRSFVKAVSEKPLPLSPPPVSPLEGFQSKSHDMCRASTYSLNVGETRSEKKGALQTELPFHLAIFTWNVGNKPPKVEELAEWLPQDGEGYELIAVGLQESDYRSPKRHTTRMRAETSMALRRRASSSALPFPQSLGPFGVVMCTVIPSVETRVIQESSTYTMPEKGLVARLAEARIRCSACLSPPHELDRWNVVWDIEDVPLSATSYCFAYPTEVSADYFSGIGKSTRLQLQADPDCALLFFGGFIFLDNTGQCVAAQALVPGDEESEGSGLHCSGPLHMNHRHKSIIERLKKQKRFHVVTIADLRQAGAEQFAWIFAGEALGDDRCDYGGFLYLFRNADYSDALYFPLQRHGLDVFAETLPMESASTNLTRKTSAGAFGLADGDSDCDSTHEHQAEVKLHHFHELVLERLGEDWNVVSKVYLRQIRLAVFARRHLVVRNIEESMSATGVGRVYGNKGSVVVGLEVRGTSLCFICSHLAANTQGHQRRKEDCQQTLRQTHIRNKSLDVTMQFDHCFWFGDLNSRIDFTDTDQKDTPETIQRGMRLVEAKAWSELMPYDQLKRAKRNGDMFMDFEEAEIIFAPTFKVKDEPGTAYKDEPEQLRVPSWCDRVLWKSLPCWRQHLDCGLFTSFPQVSTSDHKPVCAYFEVFPSHSPQMTDALPHEESHTAIPMYINELEVEGMEGLAAKGVHCSDLYITFHSEPVWLLGGMSQKTSVQRHTLNPRWKNTEVPILRAQFAGQKGIEFLSRSTLLLDVWNHEMMLSDGHIGTALVSLAELQQWPEKKGSFSIQFSAKVIRHNEWRDNACVRGVLAVYTSEKAALNASAGQYIRSGWRRPCCVVS